MATSRVSLAFLFVIAAVVTMQLAACQPPTPAPTAEPTAVPTDAPTDAPTAAPTDAPTAAPSQATNAPGTTAYNHATPDPAATPNPPSPPTPIPIVLPPPGVPQFGISCAVFFSLCIVWNLICFGLSQMAEKAGNANKYSSLPPPTPSHASAI